MKDSVSNGFAAGLIAGISVGLLILALTLDHKMHDAYQQGQVDAHNGIWKYHLVIQSDSTTKWQEKK